MVDMDFSDGCLCLEQNRYLDANTLWESHLKSAWQDGFLAFSAGEMRYKPELHEQAQAWLAGRTGDKGAKWGKALIEGFLMSGGLWRNDGKCFEELAFERVGDQFLVNYWRLDTGSEVRQCSYRPIEACVHPTSNIFGKKPISAFEVKAYEEGHHLYIVRGAHG